MSLEVQLLPALRQFEARRRRLLARVASAFFGAAVLAAVALASVVDGSLLDADLALLLVPGAGVVAAVLTWGVVIHPYRQGFKREIIGAVVSAVGPQLTYRPVGGIPEGTFNASRMFTRTPDSYRAEDHIEGTLGSTSLEISEVHAQYKTRNAKGKANWHDIFQGLLFVADFHKHFHGHTIVVPDPTQRWLGGIAQTLQGLDFTRPGDLVKLEDPLFERSFCVYSDDQVEARYILSPSFMRRLLALRERTDAALTVAFHDSRVFVAIPSSRNMFEPPLLRSALAEGLIREYFDDVRQAIGMVEELDLNTRIWSKR